MNFVKIWILNAYKKNRARISLIFSYIYNNHFLGTLYAFSNFLVGKYFFIDIYRKNKCSINKIQSMWER